MSEAVLLRCPGSHVTLKQVANDPNPAQRGLKSPATEELQRANWNVFLLSISVFQHHKTSSVQFSRHEWVVSPFSRGSSNPGIESRCPTLQVDSLPAEPQGKTRIPIVARILIGIHVSTAPSVTLFFLSKVFSQAESDFHDYCINSFCQFSDTSLPSRCY